MQINKDISVYSRKNTLKIREHLKESLTDTWLEGQEAGIYQIIDELIKNAVKSNYKFVLFYLALREEVMKSHPEFNLDQATKWLNQSLFGGEHIMMEKQIDKIQDWNGLKANVRNLLDLENSLLQRQTNRAQSLSSPKPGKVSYADYAPLMEVRRTARKINIGIHFRLERTEDRVQIIITNDAPILDEDLKRIHSVRYEYRKHAERGEPHIFFIEHMDNSGGGHGLGYALIDSILLELELDPEMSLYLVNARKTIVLLDLPVNRPDANDPARFK